MKIPKEREVKKILKNLIVLRRKKNKDPQFEKEYLEYESYCMQIFDYLVHYKTNRYREFANHEDLQQDGRIGLLKALRTFKLNKGSFYWWANRYIGTKVVREANCHSSLKIPMKHIKKMKPHKVLEMPVMIDSRINAREKMEQEQVIELVQEAIKMLPSNQAEVLTLNGIKSYSINKISEELNISIPRCIKLLNEAKQSLKKQLSEI